MAGASVPYSSVPSVESQGSLGGGETQHATPEDFGSQVGDAVKAAGDTGFDEANKFATMATESKVNDDYANKYAPASAQLRNQYDQLRGQDKIHGYDAYISGLQDLNKNFTASQPSFLGQKLMSSLIDRHITGEIDGAKRELVDSQKQFSDQSTYDLIKSNSTYAANNYNNPQIVQQAIGMNDAHIIKQAMDNGVDPNTAAGRDSIDAAQRTAKGDTAIAMINRSLESGDLAHANMIRSGYGAFIPGYQQEFIDSTLHAANIQQTSMQAVSNLKAGQPLPPVAGAPPAQVQATVANAAANNGVDANHALAVLRIESNNGQNIGTRGTIGQDKESAGKSLQEQAQALCDNLKKASSQNTAALGRESQPWESYVTYQQGAGGGPALLKAAQGSPATRAIDVLAPFYKNPKDAVSAVTDNGGNANMTAEDFVDFIHNRYDKNAAIANCNPATAEAILAPHQQGSPAVQPAATPTQSLLEFDKRVPDMMNRINAIPNYDVRMGVMRAFNQDRQNYTDSANAYKAGLINQAGQIAAQPDFTSSEQIPSEMRAALSTDSPQTLTYMEARADFNKKNTQNIVSRDKSELGSGFYSLLDKVYAPSGNLNAISSTSELQGHVGSQGDLTIAGYDTLAKELGKKFTPEGQAELAGKRALFAYGKSQISGSNAGLFIHDPKGEQMFTQWMALAMSDYNKGIEAGKTSAQLLSPSSTDYVGKSIDAYKRNPAQMTKDMVSGGDSQVPSQYVGNQTRTLMDIARDIDSGKVTRAAGESEAKKLGLGSYAQPST